MTMDIRISFEGHMFVVRMETFENWLLWRQLAPEGHPLDEEGAPYSTVAIGITDPRLNCNICGGTGLRRAMLCFCSMRLKSNIPHN